MEANNKVGAYPNADQPNQFGTFYAQFFSAWKIGGTREACWPDFMGALGIATANQDNLFPEYDLNEIAKMKEDECLLAMVKLMWEAWALSVRLSWWTYREAPDIPMNIEAAR